jgi:hypothetical protein
VDGNDGKVGIRQAQGRVIELRAGDLFYIPPLPHDSWVVGEETYVSLHLLEANRYARQPKPRALLTGAALSVSPRSCWRTIPAAELSRLSPACASIFPEPRTLGALTPPPMPAPI